MKHRILPAIGVVGTLACLVIFIAHPSFPTPDKLLIFLFFVFLIFNQGLQLLYRLVPFIGLLLVYEAFRGIVPQLNSRVNYTFMIHADKLLFGGEIPTMPLQRWLWHGSVQWYDVFLYLFYMLHFVLPIGLALVIWKLRESYYWQYVATYVSVCFAGFVTFLLFPAAPPWLAVEKGYLPHMTRISSDVWYWLGVQDFPSVYNRLSPNPVAAVPSLHAAFATLFAIFTFKLFGKKWGALSLIYPFAIYFGTVYQGEHYAIDEILGILYAVVTYLVVRYLFQKYRRKPAKKMSKKLRSA